MIIALNYFDEFEKLGYSLDREKFTKYSMIETVETVAVKNRGQNELIEAAIKVASEKKKYELSARYEKIIQQEIECVKNKIGELPFWNKVSQNYTLDFAAIKFLERDSYFLEKISKEAEIEIEDIAKKNRENIEIEKSLDIETILVEQRYGIVKSILEMTLTTSMKSRLDFSDKIDKILLNRAFGVFIFLFLMYTVFLVTFNGSAPFIDWIDNFVNDLRHTFLLAI